MLKNPFLWVSQAIYRLGEKVRDIYEYRGSIRKKGVAVKGICEYIGGCNLHN
jgi:hypothetical protein